MDSILAREWSEVQKEAKAILRAGFPFTLDFSNRLRKKIQVIKEPTFENSISWEIFETDDFSNICVRIEWDKVIDLSKFQSPLGRGKYSGKLKPTIKYIKEEIGNEINEQIEKLKSRCSSMHINENSLLLDGTVFELIFDSESSNKCFYWQEGTEKFIELDTLIYLIEKNFE